MYLAQFLCSCLERNIVYVYSKRLFFFFSRGLSTKILFSINILHALSFSPSSPLALINDGLPGLRRHANSICALLGFYAVQNSSSGATFQTPYRSQPQGSSSPRRKRAYASPIFSFDCWTPEGGTATLSRNVGKELPFYAA
jgi:hypothetical protein